METVICNVGLVVFGFAAGILGIVGRKTWDEDRRRLTLKGWTAIALFAATLTVGLTKEFLVIEQIDRKDQQRLESDKKLSEIKASHDTLVATLQDGTVFKNATQDSLEIFFRDKSILLTTASLNTTETPPPETTGLSDIVSPVRVPDELSPLAKVVSDVLEQFGPHERFYSIGRDALKESQVANIRSYGSVPLDEPLIGVLMVSRSLKEGVAFTNQGLHFSDSVRGSSHFTYQDFAVATLDIGFISIDVAGRKVMGTGYTRDFAKVLRAVQTALGPEVAKILTDKGTLVPAHRNDAPSAP